jgi:hypothetical protein
MDVAQPGTGDDTWGTGGSTWDAAQPGLGVDAWTNLAA